MAQYHVGNHDHGSYKIKVQNASPSWVAELEFISGPYRGNVVTSIPDVALQIILFAREHTFKLDLYDATVNTNLHKVEWA